MVSRNPLRCSRPRFPRHVSIRYRGGGNARLTVGNYGEFNELHAVARVRANVYVKDRDCLS